MKKTTEEYGNGDIKKEVWYDKNGSFHRSDGPAFTCYYDNGQIMYSIYIVNGKWNKTDGPAFIEYRKDGNLSKEEYWLNGSEYSKIEYEQELLKMKEEKKDRDDMNTKRKLPIGTIRKWSGKTLAKSEGGWVVIGGKNHGKLMGNFKMNPTHTEFADKYKGGV